MLRNIAEQLSRDELKGITFLVVDDQPDNLNVATLALKFRGAEVIGAADGVKGMLALETMRPTVILLDLAMPNMNGWEMHYRIRNHVDLHIRQLPVIALTAHAMDGDEEGVLNAGFNGYIAKPFDIVTFADKVKLMMNTPPRITTGFPTPPALKPDKKSGFHTRSIPNVEISTFPDARLASSEKAAAVLESTTFAESRTELKYTDQPLPMLIGMPVTPQNEPDLGIGATD